MDRKPRPTHSHHVGVLHSRRDASSEASDAEADDAAFLVDGWRRRIRDDDATTARRRRDGIWSARSTLLLFPEEVSGRRS